MKRSVCTVLFILTFIPALAVTYYMDAAKGSDDTGDGSKSTPWQSAKMAKRVFNAGDTLNVAPGTYTYLALSGTAYWGTSNDRIVVRKYPVDAAGKAVFTQIIIAGGKAYYIIEGLDVENVTAPQGIWLNGAGDAIIRNCRVSGSNMAGGSHPTYGVYVQNAFNCLLTECEVQNTRRGIELAGSDGITVKNCYVHHTIASALRTGGGQNYVFEGNRVYYQRLEWDPSAHASGISIHSHNTVIRGNIIRDFGNTRAIRFYQSVAGDAGYRNMVVENNLVFGTSGYPHTMHAPEFIDVGPNFIFRNNTFVTGATIYIAKNENGSNLNLYNNIITSGFSISYYYDQNASSSASAHTLWGNIKEGKNLYGELYSRGCGWKCAAPGGKFSSSSTSLQYSGFTVGPFFASSSGEYPYQLAAGSKAVGFADAGQVPATDLLGRDRDAQPDAGCYEFGAVTQIKGADLKSTPEIGPRSTMAPTRIYSITGKQLGKTGFYYLSLPAGIYIITRDNGALEKVTILE